MLALSQAWSVFFTSHVERIVGSGITPPDEDGEYVRLDNLGGSNATMTNWTLRDDANHVFTFPPFTLVAGESVRVWTGTGSNNSSNLYWGSGAVIWNNSGDTAILRLSNGQVVDSCTYGGGGIGANCN